MIFLFFIFFLSCLKSREDIFLGLECFDYPWQKGCVSPFLSILSTLSSAFLLYNLQCFAATVFCAWIWKKVLIFLLRCSTVLLYFCIESAKISVFVSKPQVGKFKIKGKTKFLYIQRYIYIKEWEKLNEIEITNHDLWPLISLSSRFRSLAICFDSIGARRVRQQHAGFFFFKVIWN